MTRLHYLLARNREHLPYGKLPPNVAKLFRSLKWADEFRRSFTFERGVGDEGPHWGNCVSVARHGLNTDGEYAEGRIFRVTDDLRPPGIPDDIHESYK